MTVGMVMALVFALKGKKKKCLYRFSVLTTADEFDDVKPFIEHYRKEDVDHIFIAGNADKSVASDFVTIKPSFDSIDSTWVLEVDINELLCGMSLDVIEKIPRHSNLNIAGKMLKANSERKSKSVVTIPGVVVKRHFTRKYVLGMIVELSDEQNDDEQFIEKHRGTAHIYVIGDYKTDDPNITVYNGTYLKEDVYGYARKECTWLLSVSNNMLICGDIQKQMNDHYTSFEVPIYEFWNSTNILQHEYPLATDVMRTKNALSYACVNYVPKDTKAPVRIENVQINQYMSHCRHCGDGRSLNMQDLIPDHTLASTIQIPKKYKFSVLLDITSVEDISGLIEHYQQQGVDHVYVAYNKLSLDACAYFGVFQELEYVTMLQISQDTVIPALYPTYLRNETEWLMFAPVQDMLVNMNVDISSIVSSITDITDRDTFNLMGHIVFRTCKFKSLEDVPKVAEPLLGVVPIEPVTGKMDWLD